MPLFPASSVFDTDLYLRALPAVAAGAGLVLWLLHRFWLARLSPRPPTLALSPLQKALRGALGALALVAFSVLIPAAAGSYSKAAAGWAPFLQPPGAPATPGAARVLAAFLVQTLSEELIFRGILMGGLGAVLLLLLSTVTVHALPGEPSDSPRLGAARRRTWLLAGLLANLAQSAVFTWVHGANPGLTPLASVNIGLAGFVLGWLYWSQGALWGAWTFHFVWNFALTAAGLPVSGVLASPALLPLGISGSRPGPMSGGAFGPEASVACTVGLFGVLAALLALSRRRRAEAGG
ncbi:MAG TPA: CPBP family intramembrane glutamic endopeptidase [Thermoanaerobaculia bacterium]|nr:CPBP family intramembrane glutamic endopeptidase [Thermoanaerobaculia bacterium]